MTSKDSHPEVAKALRKEARLIVADAERRAARLRKLADELEGPDRPPESEISEEMRAEIRANVERRLRAAGQIR